MGPPATDSHTEAYPFEQGDCAPKATTVEVSPKSAGPASAASESRTGQRVVLSGKA